MQACSHERRCPAAACGWLIDPPPPYCCACTADCALARKLYAAGYEIADHTISHPHVSSSQPAIVAALACCFDRQLQQVPPCLPFASPALSRPRPALARLPAPRLPLCHPMQMDSSYSQAMVENEVLGSRAKIAACGIPAADIVGFRQPFLEAQPTVRQVRRTGG